MDSWILNIVIYIPTSSTTAEQKFVPFNFALNCFLFAQFTYLVIAVRSKTAPARLAAVCAHANSVLTVVHADLALPGLSAHEHGITEIPRQCEPHTLCIGVNNFNQCQLQSPSRGPRRHCTSQLQLLQRRRCVSRAPHAKRLPVNV